MQKKPPMNMRERYQKVIAPSTIDDDMYEIVIERAEGLFVYDHDGKPYLDCDSEVAVLPLGHRHPIIEEALAKAREKIDFVEGTARIWSFEIEVAGRHYEICPPALAEKLLPSVFPKDGGRMVYGVTGGTVVEAAFMFCLKQRPERQHFMSFYGAFNGRNGYARDATCSKQIQKKHYPPGLSFSYLPMPKSQNDVNFIKKQLHYPPALDTVNAVILEAVQGEGGIEPWRKHFWQELYPIFQKHNIWIIADEIQCGMGRTGKMWGFEHCDMRPDIVTAGKGLGAGQPLGVFCYKKELEKNPLQNGWFSGTFPANQAHVAAAIVTLDLIERSRTVERVQNLGNYFALKLDRIFSDTEDMAVPHVIRKGLGLMQGVEFRDHNGNAHPAWRNAVLKRLWKKGFLTPACGMDNINPTIRFTPPYIIEKEDLDRIAQALNESLYPIPDHN